MMTTVRPSVRPSGQAHHHRSSLPSLSPHSLSAKPKSTHDCREGGRPSPPVFVTRRARVRALLTHTHTNLLPPRAKEGEREPLTQPRIGRRGLLLCLFSKGGEGGGRRGSLANTYAFPRPPAPARPRLYPSWLGFALSLAIPNEERNAELTKAKERRLGRARVYVCRDGKTVSGDAGPAAKGMIALSVFSKASRTHKVRKEGR